MFLATTRWFGIWLDWICVFYIICVVYCCVLLRGCEPLFPLHHHHFLFYGRVLFSLLEFVLSIHFRYGTVVSTGDSEALRSLFAAKEK